VDDVLRCGISERVVVMSIDKAKEILSKRTVGPYEFSMSFGLCSTAVQNNVGENVCVANQLTRPDGIAFSLLNNIADELIAVYEAAKELLRELDGRNLRDTDDLENSIQALDAKLTKELS